MVKIKIYMTLTIPTPIRKSGFMHDECGHKRKFEPPNEFFGFLHSTELFESNRKIYSLLIKRKTFSN